MKKVTASSRRREFATDDCFDFFTRPSVVQDEGVNRFARAEAVDDDFRSNARTVQHWTPEADARIDDDHAAFYRRRLQGRYNFTGTPQSSRSTQRK